MLKTRAEWFPKVQENLNATGISAVRQRENRYSYALAETKPKTRRLKPLVDDELV